MSGKDDALEKSAESITSDFVASLGLTEIILGGLALYCHHVSTEGAIAAKLPGTGHTVLDVALLVCAASLAGKILALIIALIMAIVNLVLRRMKYANELKSALANYWVVSARSGAYEKRLLETAIAAIRTDSVHRGKILDSIRTHAVIAHGAALLVFVYAKSIAKILSPNSSALPVCLAALALVILGILQQADLFGQVISFLNVARPGKNEVQHA